MTVIFDVWRHIGWFSLAPKILNAYFDLSSSCARTCLHYKSSGGDEGGFMKSVSRVAHEQQDGVAEFHRLDGAAQPPNT